MHARSNAVHLHGMQMEGRTEGAALEHACNRGLFAVWGPGKPAGMHCATSKRTPGRTCCSAARLPRAQPAPARSGAGSGPAPRLPDCRPPPAAAPALGCPAASAVWTHAGPSVPAAQHHQVLPGASRYAPARKDHCCAIVMVCLHHCSITNIHTPISMTKKSGMSSKC